MKAKRIVPISAALVLAGAAVVVVFLPGLVAPWSRLNNEEHELDLCCGRVRVTRHFLWVQVGQEMLETPLSQALAGESAGGGPQWVRVNTFQPWVRTSPNYLYHGAVWYANATRIHWDMYKCDPAARAKISRQLLRVLREAGSDSAGSDYLRLLDESLHPREGSGRATAAGDIPDDLVDRALALRAQQP
jgi:hypothetical protein